MKVLSIIERANGRTLAERNRRNAQSVSDALEQYGAQFGLDKSHRLAQFLAQLAHESAGFRYDREVWGPTPAQKRYEGRRDIGNTKQGDGKRFAGRGPIQITGRSNYREFTKWAKNTIGSAAPDFEARPEKINTSPWEGLVAIWYWSTRRLNRYADQGDPEMVTRRINGGLNGYRDRLRWLVRFSLVMLGYRRDDVRAFQVDAGLLSDGVPGPRTRAALHKALSMGSGIEISAAPVVETKAATPEQIDRPLIKTSGFWERAVQFVGAGGIGSLAAFTDDWKTIAVLAAALMVVAALGLLFHKQILDAVRRIKAEVRYA